MKKQAIVPLLGVLIAAAPFALAGVSATYDRGDGLGAGRTVEPPSARGLAVASVVVTAGEPFPGYEVWRASREGTLHQGPGSAAVRADPLLMLLSLAPAPDRVALFGRPGLCQYLVP